MPYDALATPWDDVLIWSPPLPWIESLPDLTPTTRADAPPASAAVPAQRRADGTIEADVRRPALPA